MVVFHPGKELPALFQQFRIAALRPLPDVFHCIRGTLVHFLPILHRQADVGHRQAQPCFNRGERFWIVLPVDLHMDDGFGFALAVRGRVEAPDLAFAVPVDVNDGMRHKMDTQVHLGHGQAGGIHQERHIVVGHLQDGVLAFPTVLVHVRVEYPEKCFTCGTSIKELHLLGHDSSQHGGLFPA